MKLVSVVGLVLVLVGCAPDVKEDSVEIKKVSANIIRKAVEFDQLNKPTKFELYTNENGVSLLVGIEEVYGNGNIKIRGGVNANGQRDGLWEAFYEDGTSWSIGNYSSGKETGDKKVWYPNGKLRYQGLMRNDSLVGKWQFWDSKGALTEKEYK